MTGEKAHTEGGIETQQCSRRAVLVALGPLVAGGVAGCSGNGSPEASPTASPGSPTAEISVFDSIRFENQEMVLELTADHTVRRVNLIAPDGTLFTRARVATGATTVRLPILEIEPVDYTHYDPGTYKLTAITDGEPRSQKLELRPGLTVTGVEAWPVNNHLTHLGVTLQNTGTAPTWPYGIAYQGSPSVGSNTDLIDLPGSPHFLNTEGKDEIILGPGQSQTYVGGLTPLRFNDKHEYSCTGDTAEFTIRVGRVVGDPLERRVQITFNGEKETTSTLDRFACSETTTTLIDGGATDA